MDEAAIKKRLAELQQQLKQIEASGNATVGAIQELERWLKLLQLDKKE